MRRIVWLYVGSYPKSSKDCLWGIVRYTSIRYVNHGLYDIFLAPNYDALQFYDFNGMGAGATTGRWNLTYLCLRVMDAVPRHIGYNGILWGIAIIIVMNEIWQELWIIKTFCECDNRTRASPLLIGCPLCCKGIFTFGVWNTSVRPLFAFQNIIILSRKSTIRLKKQSKTMFNLQDVCLSVRNWNQSRFNYELKFCSRQHNGGSHYLSIFLLDRL